MVEGVGDDVLVQVIAQIAVEPRPDVFIDRLQLDEDKRKAVNKADQIGPAIVAGGTQTGDLQLANGKEAIVRLPTRPCSVLKINHPRLRMAKLTLGITVAHRHAIADISVKLLVVLQEGSGEINTSELLHGLGDGFRRQLRVEPPQRRSQVPCQHHLARVGPSKRATRPEGFIVPGIDALPAQSISSNAPRRSPARAGLRC